jgi:hypothetical protein
MTVTTVGVIPGSHKASNDRGIRTYEYAWRVTTTEPDTEGPFAVGSATGLPVLGGTWPEDLSAYCYALNVDADEPPNGWTVTAKYTSERETNATPTLAGPRVSWSSSTVEVPIWVTVESAPVAIVNSAGDFFDQVPTRSETRFTANITANLTSYGTLLNAMDYINSTAMTIDGVSIPARCGKLAGVSISEAKLQGTIAYVEASYSIEVNPHTWLYQPLDCGFRARDSSGDFRIIRNKDTTPVTNPALLDGTGGVVANPGPTTAVFGSYKIYGETSFSFLPGIT